LNVYLTCYPNNTIAPIENDYKALFVYYQNGKPSLYYTNLITQTTPNQISFTAATTATTTAATLQAATTATITFLITHYKQQQQQTPAMTNNMSPVPLSSTAFGT
jgi:hypothetical protein